MCAFYKIVACCQLAVAAKKRSYNEALESKCENLEPELADIDGLSETSNLNIKLVKFHSVEFMDGVENSDKVFVFFYSIS